jgi:ArsR family transcriptional regulator, arsenate/arsenite/antimonite-responsive transcriptional repressor
MADLTKIFKALGDPTRFAIFELVRECGDPDGCSEEQAGDNLSQIAERFYLSLPTVSHHVRELRNSGIITCEKRGQRLSCRVDAEVLRELEQFAGPTAVES